MTKGGEMEIVTAEPFPSASGSKNYHPSLVRVENRSISLTIIFIDCRNVNW